MFNERRKYERIECYMIIRQAQSEQDEDDLFGFARNISAGGAQIETEAEIEVQVGQTMDLSFMLDEERQVWETRGRVVWTRCFEDRTLLGLEFVQPLEENWRKRLD